MREEVLFVSLFGVFSLSEKERQYRKKKGYRKKKESKLFHFSLSWLSPIHHTPKKLVYSDSMGNLDIREF